MRKFLQALMPFRHANHVTVESPRLVLATGPGDDVADIRAPVGIAALGSGHDTVTADALVARLDLGSGDDSLVASHWVADVHGGAGDDLITLGAGAGSVRAGSGDDVVTLGAPAGFVHGGAGTDRLVLDVDAGAMDIAVERKGFVLTDRFTGEQMTIRNIEVIEFADRTFTARQLADLFDPAGDVPVIQVGGGTQTVTVNDTDCTISVIWDRVVQQAAIESDFSKGPTVASRAYAMVHTAMYDAWSAYDEVATTVSFDLEGDNLKVTGTDADKTKAMSYAALAVLEDLFPDMAELCGKVMETRLGFSLDDDGSVAARIGIDAAQDLLALRGGDGANQANFYADTTGYVPVNPSALETRDITRWTAESVPVDPENAPGGQSFLTPQWSRVEAFGLARDESHETDFTGTLPPAPEGFFTGAYAGSVLDFAARTITLDAAVTLDGVTHAAGATIAVDRALIGTVINPGFIAQAEEVVAYSAALTDEHKIVAEFWEDGGRTAYPPGTWMTFGEFVSARDDHSLDEDAKMFLALGNAVMDAGIATWHSKVVYDYARPVRVIRDLGELGLIGEWGIDGVTGEEGWVIEAFGGFDEDGRGLGTRTILAENFVTYQRPGGHPSPPFAEHTSGHSAFSAAGAEVLARVTGSDRFGGSVTFAPGTVQFEQGVPAEEVTLTWATFSDAADEAGLSRLYGGIHFSAGDTGGRALGRDVGASAYDRAQLFIDGAAGDADRPFYGDDFLFA